MAAPVRGHLFLLCLSIYWLATGGRAATIDITNAHLNRSEFPNGFIFGSAGAAYQFEGAWNKGGKGPSVWDTFTHKYPEKIADRSNGDVATNSYNQYPEDVKLLQDMNMDAYRFSIAWPRILPTGSLSGGINKEGVQYYNKLINLVKSKGIDPFATLFHWDTPQGLEDKYGGFLSEKIAVDFRDFAEVCFKEFGDRVKHWITLNEPWSYANQAYAVGSQAPGRCSAWMNNSCTGGDSATEPYVVSHNLLLAHAAAARLYKDKYQASQKGVIGITLSSNWFIPFKAHSKDDIDAAQRSLDFMLGWYMDPLTHGDYPFIMRAVVGERLPRFTDAQSASIKGSFDFIGINYYTTYYAESLSLSSNLTASSTNDPHKNLQVVRGGKLLGPMAGSSWLFVYPPGIRKLLLYVKSRYNSPVIYITENGIDEVNNGTLPLEEALKDDHRIDYHYRHLLFLQKAIREGVDVRGYFAWSLLDNFEWGEGYTVRFGLNFVDFKNGLKRYPKKSALWFRSVLKK